MTAVPGESGQAGAGDWRGRFPAAAGFLLLAAAALMLFGPFQVDDAYISFVYAKNLAEGRGLTYNGITVEGYSNFLWTVLIAAGMKLGGAPLALARGLSLASLGAAWAAALALQRRFFPNSSPFDASLASLAALLTAPVLAWTMGGLETVFFTSLVALAAAFELSARRGAGRAATLLALLAALTRPEGLIVIAALSIHRLLDWRNGRGRLLESIALFGAPYLGFLAWRWLAYGALLPNTAYLKLDPGLERVRLALEWLLGFILLRPIFALLVFGGAAAVALGKPRARGWALPGLLLLGFTGFVLYAGRDWMPHHRFLVPALPLLGLGVGGLLEWARGPRIKFAVRAGIALAILFEIGMSLGPYRGLTMKFARFLDGQVRAGQAIRQMTGPEEVIAVVDAGALAYYSERRTIDILGLNDAWIARTPGHSDPDYVLGFEPQIIQLHAGFNREGEILGVAANEAMRDLIGHDTFSRCYRPDPARPDDPYYPLLYLRICP